MLFLLKKKKKINLYCKHLLSQGVGWFCFPWPLVFSPQKGYVAQVVRKWHLKLLWGLFHMGSSSLNWVHHRLPVPKAMQGSQASFSLPVCSLQEQGLRGTSEVPSWCRPSHRCLPGPCYLLCLLAYKDQVVLNLGLDEQWHPGLPQFCFKGQLIRDRAAWLHLHSQGTIRSTSWLGLACTASTATETQPLSTNKYKC